MPDEILVVDDDPDSRRAIAESLNRAGYATATASDGDEALAIAERDRPALVVSEVLLPGTSGYEVCHAVKERYGAQVPVVLISERRTEPADRVAALLIGADDFVAKPVPPVELTVRVRRLLAVPGAGSSAAVEALTARERDVMELLTRGLSQVEIAERLVITQRTVAKHIEHILAKLKVHTRAQAVALAMRRRREAIGPATGEAHEPSAVSGG